MNFTKFSHSDQDFGGTSFSFIYSYTLPLRAEFPVFWEFLGILKKFPTMQISSDLKSLELLGISGKGRLQFCEDLESLGIPRNSQLYKLPII